MLRASPQLYKTTLMMLRRDTLPPQRARVAAQYSMAYKGQGACELPRKPCPPPKVPPPPPPPDDSLFWSIMGLFLLAGGFAYYARNQPEIRDWLSLRAQWFDDLISAVFEEERSLMETFVLIGGRIKKRLRNWWCTDKSECLKPKTSYPPCPPDFAANEIKKIKEEEQKKKDKEKAELIECTNIRSELEDTEPYCEVAKPPVPCKKEDLCEIDRCLKDLALDTINNYLVAVEANQLWNKAVPNAMQDFTYQKMKGLKRQLKERKELVKKHTADAKRVNKRLDELKKYFKCACSDFDCQILQPIRKAMERDQKEIKYLKQSVVIEGQESEIRDQQYNIVKCFIGKYAAGNKALWGGLNYGDQSPKINGFEDYLLIQNKKYLERLAPEVKAKSEAYSQRVDRGVDSLGLCEKDKKAKIAAAYAEASKAKVQEYTDRIAAVRNYYKEETCRRKSKATREHNALLESRLADVDRDMNAALQKEVEAEMNKERKKMNRCLVEMKAKLNVVEERLKDRIKAEKDAKRGKQLYMAGTSLLNATQRGGSSQICVNDQLKIINKNIGDGDKPDKLVSTVMESIPGDVYNQGIVPESVLKERFNSMEKVALDVAMLDAEGGPLPLYMFSWLQSKLLFMKLKTIPQAEIDNPPKEPFTGMDTFDLMQRARYYMDRGNIAMALRYVDNLKGASRGAAESWYQDAKKYVQTKQAAEAIVAHASSLSAKTL